MKVFIQQLGTGLFLRTANQWIKTTDQALSFRGTAQAIDFCVRRGVRAVRLLVRDGVANEDTYIHPFENEAMSPASDHGRLT